MFITSASKLSRNARISLKHFFKPRIVAAYAHTKPYSTPTYVQPCTAHTYTKSYVVPSYKAFDQTSAHKSCKNINPADADNSKRIQKNNTLQGDSSLLFIAGACIILEKMYDGYASKDSTSAKPKKVDLDISAHASFIKAICDSKDHGLNIIEKNKFKSDEHVPITYGTSIPFGGSLDHPCAQIGVKNVDLIFFQGYFTINYKFSYDPNLRLTPKMLNKFEADIMKGIRVDNNQIIYRVANLSTSSVLRFTARYIICTKVQTIYRAVNLSTDDVPGVINFKITVIDDKIYCHSKGKK